MTSIKQLLKDYKWNSRGLKRRYQIYDWSALGLVVVILLLYRFMEGSLPYIMLSLLLIIILEILCYRIKGQDKKIGRSKEWTKLQKHG